MDLSTMLVPVASLGTMGLLFGAGLAYASQKFAVEVDPRITAISEALPGANCGGCGYPGCGGFATAVVEGKAPVNGCPVGGAECAEKIAEVMGVAAGSGVKKVARVICNGVSENCKEKYDYSGIEDCRAAAMLGGGPKSCAYACMGLGTCIKACSFDAIVIKDGIASIDKDKCVSCGKCLDVCPKDVIQMVPYDQEVIIDCSNKEKGKVVKDNCKVGCIGCQICVKSCPFEAITFENNLAKIDYDKCTNCMVCVQKCPTKAIAGNLENRKKAYIVEENCVGCTICKKQCPVDAIEGELKAKHKVIEDKCIGCSACAKKCPKKCIEMK